MKKYIPDLYFKFLRYHTSCKNYKIQLPATNYKIQLLLISHYFSIRFAATDIIFYKFLELYSTLSGKIFSPQILLC